MNTMDKQVYLNNRGGHCPYCGSREMEAGCIKEARGQFFQTILCLGCASTWTDIYTLTDIEENKELSSDELDKLYHATS